MIMIICDIHVAPDAMAEFTQGIRELARMVRERREGHAIVYACHHLNEPGMVRITEAYADWDALRRHSAEVIAAAPHFHGLFDIVRLEIAGASPPADLTDKYGSRYPGRTFFFDREIASA